MENSTFKSGLAIQHDMFRKAIDSALFADAKANNADALFTIGLTALHYNRIDFAWAFCKLAAKSDHTAAKNCLAFLEDKQLSIASRRRKCLSLII